MVEYWEETKEDSKTKYFNPTGCGALAFVSKGFPSLYPLSFSPVQIQSERFCLS